MDELIATNSVILHEQYFGNLGEDRKSELGRVQRTFRGGTKIFGMLKQE